jgi:hypothetical protein
MYIKSKTRVLCHVSLLLIRYTYDSDPAISSGVIPLFVFSVLAPGGQTKNQTGPKFGPSVTFT